MNKPTSAHHDHLPVATSAVGANPTRPASSAEYESVSEEASSAKRRESLIESLAEAADATKLCSRWLAALEAAGVAPAKAAEIANCFEQLSASSSLAAVESAVLRLITFFTDGLAVAVHDMEGLDIVATAVSAHKGSASVVTAFCELVSAVIASSPPELHIEVDIAGPAVAAALLGQQDNRDVILRICSMLLETATKWDVSAWLHELGPALLQTLRAWIGDAGVAAVAAQTLAAIIADSDDCSWDVNGCFLECVLEEVRSVVSSHNVGTPTLAAACRMLSSMLTGASDDAARHMAAVGAAIANALHRHHTVKADGDIWSKTLVMLSELASREAAAEQMVTDGLATLSAQVLNACTGGPKDQLQKRCCIFLYRLALRTSPAPLLAAGAGDALIAVLVAFTDEYAVPYACQAISALRCRLGDSVPLGFFPARAAIAAMGRFPHSVPINAECCCIINAQLRRDAKTGASDASFAISAAAAVVAAVLCHSSRADVCAHALQALVQLAKQDAYQQALVDADCGKAVAAVMMCPTVGPNIAAKVVSVIYWLTPGPDDVKTGDRWQQDARRRYLIESGAVKALLDALLIQGIPADSALNALDALGWFMDSGYAFAEQLLGLGAVAAAARAIADFQFSHPVVVAAASDVLKMLATDTGATMDMRIEPASFMPW